ncbi:MAG: HD domain-containing protein [Candidatus Heimdallarchaeota archaeon]
MVFSRSLTEEERKILEQMQEFVRTQHAHSDSHDYSHVFSVVRFSIMIANGIEEEVDPFVTIAGGLLHDIGKTTNVFGHFHGLFGGSIAEEYLDGIEIDKDLRDRICRVVIRHTPTSGIPPIAPEEKVVYDADTLDRLGLMGLLRGFMGKEGSMKAILTKYLEKRLLDYDKLNYEISTEVGMGMNQELEGFAFIIQKRLDDRLSSISDLFTALDSTGMMADAAEEFAAARKRKKAKGS